MKIKILRIGLITLLASLLVVVLLVGKFGVNVKRPLLTAASCGGRCAINCNEDETGQGKGTGGCPSDQHNCVPNVCSTEPNAGTSCEKPTTVNGVSIPAGVCVSKDIGCPAGKNRPGSCNTDNTDCCTTAGSTTAPGAVAGCVFDHYQKNECVQINGSWQRCKSNPKGEMGHKVASCDNTVKGNGGKDSGCTDEHPDCVTGPNCVNLSQSCIPSVPEYANCVADTSCLPTNPNNPIPTSINTPTPTPTATPTFTPTATPTTTPISTPTYTPTSTPNYCNGTCGSNLNCQSGYFCYNGSCRNPSCQDESDCSCGSTSTPTPTTPPVLGASTPPNLPKTGSNLLVIVAGLLSTIGVGVFFFKKFKLI